MRDIRQNNKTQRFLKGNPIAYETRSSDLLITLGLMKGSRNHYHAYLILESLGEEYRRKDLLTEFRWNNDHGPFTGLFDYLKMQIVDCREKFSLEGIERIYESLDQIERTISSEFSGISV